MDSVSRLAGDSNSAPVRADSPDHNTASDGTSVASSSSLHCPQPRMLPQQDREQTAGCKTLSQWLIEDMPADELAVDSPRACEVAAPVSPQWERFSSAVNKEPVDAVARKNTDSPFTSRPLPEVANSPWKLEYVFEELQDEHGDGADNYSSLSPQDLSPDVSWGPSDLPRREDVDRFFKSGHESKHTIKSPTESRQSLQRLNKKAEHSAAPNTQQGREQLQHIEEAVESLVRAQSLMAALTVDEKALALTYASGRGYLTVVRRLVREGVELTAVDGRGETAISAAARNHHGEVVRYLSRHAPESKLSVRTAHRSDKQHEQVAQWPEIDQELVLKENLQYNIRKSLRTTNRPERHWYGQSPADDLSRSREDG